ncbi:unnamed protein product, partial [Brenthis ino]
MASVVEYLHDGYKYLFEDLVHPLSKDYFLVSHPLKIISILVAYNFFCLKLGPWFMKDRKPYDLKNVIKIYNIFQILVSLYMFYVGSVYVFNKDFDFRCTPVDDPTSERAAMIVPNIYLFFMVKLIDLLDTVFFVLRKSFRQITPLHIYHHTMMPLVAWFGLTYFPGGQGVLIGHVNALVHAIMYSYYLIAGLGEEYKKFLWWKKYLTMLQLVQFSIFIVQGIPSLFYECGFPTILKILILINAATFINLFGRFYYNCYVKPNKINGVQNGNSIVKTVKVH